MGRLLEHKVFSDIENIQQVEHKVLDIENTLSDSKMVNTYY